MVYVREGGREEREEREGGREEREGGREGGREVQKKHHTP